MGKLLANTNKDRGGSRKVQGGVKGEDERLLLFYNYHNHFNAKISSNFIIKQLGGYKLNIILPICIEGVAKLYLSSKDDYLLRTILGNLLWGICNNYASCIQKVQESLVMRISGIKS